MNLFTYLMAKKGEFSLPHKDLFSYLLGRNNSTKTVTGTELEIKGRKIINLLLSKESTQEGTPTPDNPIDVNTIKTNIDIIISNGTDTKTITIPLGDNEICGIGDYKDELIIDSFGRCYLKKKTGKVVLNGSETWTYQYAHAWNTEINNLKQTSGNNEQPYLLCNYYEKGSANVVYQRSYGIAQPLNISKVIIHNADIETSTELKTWLSTHNTIVYYVLDVESLINLNYTVDLKLLTGTNTITNSENATMTVTYL